MNADAFYSIGATHDVCQDYAVAGRHPDGTAYAVVSDGCSASPDSDMGARLLARLAEQRLLAARPDVGRETVARAAELAAPLGLGMSSLDATLLVARQTADHVRVTLAGDGVVAARHREGPLHIWQVEYEEGAPAYLSYSLEPRRFALYLSESRQAARRLRHYENGAWSETIRYGMAVDSLVLPLGDYDLLLLLSDGVTSFDTRAEGRVAPVATERVVAELARVKSPAGRFIVRRARRFLSRFCPARGWSHRDDLAIAALWWGEGS